MRRRPVALPALQRQIIGVLDGVLGAVDIAEDAGEQSHCPAPLVTEVARDELGAGCAGPILGGRYWSSSIRGRISIEP